MFYMPDVMAQGHKCTKGKAHYIEVYSNSKPEDYIEHGMDGGDGGP